MNKSTEKNYQVVKNDSATLSKFRDQKALKEVLNMEGEISELLSKKFSLK